MHQSKDGYLNQVDAERRVPLPSGITASIVAYKTDPGQLTNVIMSLSGSDQLRHMMIIDNSPDDRLRGSVESAGVEYFRPERNLGFGSGHNVALEKYSAAARYHVVVNPDITCSSSVLNELYRFMESHADIGLVMPRVLYPDGKEQRLCKLLPAPMDLILRRFASQHAERFADRLDRYELRHLDLSISREIPSLSGCFMFIRCSALREVGFFDERFFMYMEDVDLCRRIGIRYKTVFHPVVSVTHEYAKGSYQSMKLLRHHVSSAMRYFGKWGWIHDPQRKKMNCRTNPVAQSPNLTEDPNKSIKSPILEDSSLGLA